MYNFYDHWLKVDKWTFQQASMLFCGIDPKEKGAVFEDTNIMGHLHINKMKAAVLPVYEIFQLAKWENYGELLEPETVYQEIFFKLAVNKKIDIPEELLKKRSEYFKSEINAGKGQFVFSPELEKTLRPLAETIKDFKNCDDFIKHKNDIQQGIIENWLKDRGLKSAEIRVFKEFITRHYGITSARKN